MTVWTDEMRVALARAVLPPGERVRLYPTSQNELGDYVDVEWAVASGRAYAGQARAEILALDQDASAGFAVIRHIVGRLRSHGVEAVVLTSGGHDRHHLFAYVEDAALRRAMGERARAGGVDVRCGAGRLIRPPGAPHRSRARPQLLEPSLPEWALQALQAPRRRPPNSTYERLLVHGDVAGRRYGGDRSALMAAITLSYLQRGHTYDDMWRLFTDATHVAGAKLRERRERAGYSAARQLLLSMWWSALETARTAPAPTGPLEVLVELVEARDAVREMAWPGAAGTSDRHVLLYLYDLAIRIGSVSVGAAQRTIAEQVGRRHQTVGLALRRLEAGGWLHRASTSSTQASIYELRPSRAGLKTAPVLIPTSGGVVSTGAATSPPVDHGHDAFRRGGGMSGKASVVYEALRANPQSAVQVAQSMNMNVATVRRNLTTLAANGLAAQQDGGWCRGHASLAEVAEMRATVGVRETQHLLHRHERATYFGLAPSDGLTVIGRGAWQDERGTLFFQVLPG